MSSGIDALFPDRHDTPQRDTLARIHRERLRGESEELRMNVDAPVRNPPRHWISFETVAT